MNPEARPASALKINRHTHEIDGKICWSNLHNGQQHGTVISLLKDSGTANPLVLFNWWKLAGFPILSAIRTI